MHSLGAEDLAVPIQRPKSTPSTWSVETWLRKQLNLSDQEAAEYAEKMKCAGAKRLSFLHDQQEENVDALISNVGMQPLLAQRVKQCLRDEVSR